MFTRTFNLLLIFLTLFLHPVIGQQGSSTLIKLSNSRLEIYFTTRGELAKIVADQDAIASDKDYQSHPIWELSLLSAKGETLTLNPGDFQQFESRLTNSQNITMTWSESHLPGIVVTAEVSLPSNDSLSHWNLQVKGIRGYALENIRYPIISSITADQNSLLALPNWMGHLVRNPLKVLSGMYNKAYKLVYPGAMSMQFLTLYTPSRKGIYLACNDSLAHQKDFMLSLNDQQGLVYQTISYPEHTFEKDTYAIPYQTVVGVNDGDWFTAAEIYRQWAHKQDWTRNSRLKNGHTPTWLDSTALWVWNRGRTQQVLTPAMEVREKLGLPVSVLWHWWHRSSYDDTFPDYLPPRDGADRFSREVAKAKLKDVNAIVYMNQLQWARSTPSWSRENALLSAAKNRDGSTTDHIYNIFTGKTLTNMCIATETWRKKYTGIADTVLNQYRVSGIYMDQACLSRMCFDTTHNHPLGGGNYWMRGSAELAKQVRNVTSPDLKGKITLSGEGVGESWLPYLDAFLALQVSMERYAGIGAEPIPLFQAVYHPYAVVYGNYSSLLKPPYDEMWPDEHRPTDALELLDPVYNRQFLMEQARSFVWGMQPMLSNYRSSLENDRAKEMEFLYKIAKIRNRNKAYLLYGEMMKNLHLDYSEDRIAISKLSIYAGQKEKVTHFEKNYPTLYTSVWRSESGSLGIAIANIAEEYRQIPMKLTLADYGIENPHADIFLHTADGRQKIAEITDGKLDLKLEVPAVTVRFVEIIPTK